MGWPAIAAPTYTSGGEVYHSQIRTEFEGGYVQSRKRNTRPTRRWSLHWNAMSHADWLLLEEAFINDQGNEFPWTEPITDKTYTVRYSEDRIRWSHTDKGYRQVSVAIEEI